MATLVIQAFVSACAISAKMIKPIRPIDIAAKNDKTEYLLRLKGATYSLSTNSLDALMALLVKVKGSKKPTNWILGFEYTDEEKKIIQKGLF